MNNNLEKHPDVDLAVKYLNKRNAANSRGIAFTLSFTAFKNLMRAKTCHYTGVAFSDVVNDPNYRSIDRINANLPYESGNVVACTTAFNSLKGWLEKDGSIHNKKFQASMIKMFNKVNAKSSPETTKPTAGRKAANKAKNSSTKS